MEEIKKEHLIEKMIYSINDFKDEMVKSMNYMREDIRDLKGEINDLRSEFRDYKEENNRRWDENDRRWKENELRWEKYETNRNADRKFLLDTLTQYDISISEQLKDPNAYKMRKMV